MNNKLTTDYMYISQINMLGNHLQKAYGLKDKELQELKNKIHKAVEEAVEQFGE